MMKRLTFILFTSFVLVAQINNPNDPNLKMINDVFLLVSNDEDALERLNSSFHLSQVPMFLEVLNFIESSDMQQKIIGVLEKQTDQSFGMDIQKWYSWLWNQTYEPNPYYAEFKAHLYSYVDAKFKAYYSYQYPTKIRLDEVRWGGVTQDGIPPLNEPKLLSADEAEYLDDDDEIYGIEYNGEFRAYPKRIIAWHELLTETIGESSITGVFCSLCGTMIVYESAIGERKFSFGTSGFLYRSNKLMFDKETNSLWSTYYGEPVVGIMVNQGLKLNKISVTATTWKAWKDRHPETKVLDIETGHDRNYDEGEAYKDYFNSDKLMFSVPNIDKRLANKAEVIVFHHENKPYAISRKFLKNNPIYHHEEFVAITQGHESRVYMKSNNTFLKWVDSKTIEDDQGIHWSIEENRLLNKNENIDRIVSYPSFWFGWYAAYPNTELIK
jgi:hypothetical protein